MTESDYKKMYEEEHIKCGDYATRIADLEAENEELQWKLSRIKNNVLWKLSGPFRKCIHFFIRQKDRLKNLGGLRGFIHKVFYKKREHEAMSQFGTASFPSPEEVIAQRGEKFNQEITFSILVPVYNTPKEFLIDMLDSVINQTYENWELCLADGSEAGYEYVEETCREYMNKLEQKSGKARIRYEKLKRNEGIAGNTNYCLKMATGEYIGLLDNDDIIHPSLLYEYAKAINEKGADFLYCDETTFKGGNIDKMLTMHFKPDYAPDNLRANNYICHFSCFSKKLLDGDELFRSKYDGSQDHDMILRLTDNAKCVVHIPKLLYYWRSHSGSVASGIEAKPYAITAAKQAVSDHLQKHGYRNFRISSTRAFETIFRIRYEVIGNPKVSILIPNKDHVNDLRRLITSVVEKSTYDNYEIIIMENNSSTPEIKAYYTELLEMPYEEGILDNEVITSKNGRIKIVLCKGTFNYSTVNNKGAAVADGEYLLLLNNDTEVITVNWIEELLMYAQREDVGAVGAKLLYPDKTIQHAGVVIGLGAHGTAGHSHYKQHRQNLGYMGRLCYTQNVSAVTGACLMVKKSLFHQVNGMDESFQISLNDVDFCLKLREMGRLNVFTPFAELFHHESISRGADDQGENAERYNKESALFRKKWKAQLEAGDPYYNVNFSLEKSDFSLKIKEQNI
ncbi:glycosyltransferase family 2 protein [Lachnospiraceae bacterium OttesenSCG-928-D06]|nr:glycosyltransferase family 2 protein [Lachnospiraceae bacterium OttesenSCG-928-D06]